MRGLGHVGRRFTTGRGTSALPLPELVSASLDALQPHVVQLEGGEAAFCIALLWAAWRLRAR